MCKQTLLYENKILCNDTLLNEKDNACCTCNGLNFKGKNGWECIIIT